MADKRPDLDEETLRETRDDLLTRVTDQQRQFGMLPDVRAAEKFIDPILRKVEIDHAKEQDKDSFREPARKNVSPDDLSLSRRGKPLPEGTRRIEKPIGTFLMGKPGQGLKQLSGAPWVEQRETPNVAAARHCFRMMRSHPDWKARVEKILFAVMPLKEREVRLREVLADYVRLYGDPRKPKDRKIQL